MHAHPFFIIIYTFVFIVLLKNSLSFFVPRFTLFGQHIMIIIIIIFINITTIDLMCL